MAETFVAGREPEPAGPLSLAEAAARLADAEDTLRAIRAGEVDAFVVADPDPMVGHQVFTLTSADRPYRIFVENMRDGAATLSSTGVVLYANRRLAELLVSPTETVVGSPLARFVVSDVPLEIETICGPDGRGDAVELDLRAGDGRTVPVLVGSSILDLDGDRFTCLTFTDLSAQKAQDREIARLGRAQTRRLVELQDAQAALTRQATHDELTGLPNRALLVDRITQALVHSKRFGRTTAVIFVDLDRFKQVNDTYGHGAGDRVLQRAAHRLVSALRPMDTVARIGGDEFVVLAPEVDSRPHAVDISTRLLTELARPPEGDDDGEPIGASLGVSVSVQGRGPAEVLLSEADAAMYQAKSRGGGCVEVFDSVLGLRVKQRSIEQRMLQAALDEHRVVVHYQPIIDLTGGTVAGFEALARVRAPDGSLLPPGAFIPVAEDSGLVVPLGNQVLTMACHEAHRWPSAGQVTQDGPTVAVNVAARQFLPGDLATVVRTTLARTGLPANRLHLEITETAIIDLRPDVIDQLGHIRDLGAQIGLDDFGTGYASLTHLRRLPLTFVKIDRSFVQGLGTDAGDERIVAAVIDLAANLGLRSIAEGVETDEQRQRLRDLGCDQVQGFLFAQPMPPGELAGAAVRIDAGSVPAH